MVNEPSPVEVADKLFHREFLPQRLDPFHTIVWITEDSHLSINTLEGGFRDPRP